MVPNFKGDWSVGFEHLLPLAQHCGQTGGPRGGRTVNAKATFGLRCGRRRGRRWRGGGGMWLV